MSLSRAASRILFQRRPGLQFPPLRAPAFRTSAPMTKPPSTPAAEPTNLHVSVDAEGRSVSTYTFESEALGMPAAEGWGWAQFEFGETVGPDGRYTIARKLGWGMHSSTWLAHDGVDQKYVAIKALTGHMTAMGERGLFWEGGALAALAQPPPSEHCIALLDDFKIPGRGSAGTHRCFVTPVYGGDVKALAHARTTPLPLPLAKRIITHLLRGLAHAHGRGVVHTDLKRDNIVFDTHVSTADIEKWVATDPPRRHPPEQSDDGIVRAAVSQPLPIPSEEEALRATYLLADFGCALQSDLHDDRQITTIPLRAPEVFLGGKWDKPADIWSLGCLVYELVTSRHLFAYEYNKKWDLSEVENMLYQMMVFSGEVFRAAQLAVCPLAIEYFNPADCSMKKDPKVLEWPLDRRIRTLNVVPNNEILHMADFIRRCLRLDPNNRPTAQDLLMDPWLQEGPLPKRRIRVAFEDEWAENGDHTGLVA